MVKTLPWFFPGLKIGHNWVTCQEKPKLQSSAKRLDVATRLLPTGSMSKTQAAAYRPNSTTKRTFLAIG